MTTVNLSALAGAGQQFFDNSGIPLVGGKLWSYAAGSTTPQVTYTSADGDSEHQHTNPIVLNAGGRVPGGEIWLVAGENYKFVLMTSANVVLDTWDNITGINGTGITSDASTVSFTGANGVVGTVADLATDAGSDFVGFTQSGDGSISSTVQTKLREMISVKDFGAMGDGVTDDTLSIAAAVNAVVNQNGGILYFPSGTYINAGINIYSNVVFQGDGPGATILKLKPSITSADWITTNEGTIAYAGIPMIYNQYPGDGVISNYALYDLTLDGNSENQTTLANVGLNWGVYGNKVTYVTIKNVISQNFMNHGFAFKESSHCVIDGCSGITNGQNFLKFGGSAGGDGFDFSDASSDNFITNCYAYGNGGIGFEDEGRFGPYIPATKNYRNNWVNCIAETSISGHGFLFDWTGDTIVSNCISIGSSYNGFEFLGTTNCRASNLIAYQSGHNGIYCGPESTFGANGTNYNLRVNGATILKSALYGIRIDQSIDCAFENIIIKGAGDSYAIGVDVAHATNTIGSTNITLNVEVNGTVYPAWQPNTAYSLGDLVSSNVNTYCCTKAGTSGSTAPSGKNTFDDGTVVWTWVEDEYAQPAFGVYSYNSNYLRVYSSKFISCSGTGIWLDGEAAASTGVKVQNCVFTNNGQSGFYYTSGIFETNNNLVEGLDNFENGRVFTFNDQFVIVSSVAGRRTVSSSNIPTQKSWENGDKVINSVATIGTPKGWVCTDSGTFGSLSGVTGTVINGNTSLIVNDATNLYVGCYISISGVTGVYRISSVTENNCVIYPPADSSATDASISFSAPSFTSEGNL